MAKRGITWSALGWVIIGVLFLLVILFVIMLSSGKLNSLVDVAKSLLRFGG
ncbi:MAG: hypothetical protein V1702_05840 [Candidatus Woesearchaeota archaeon]